MFNYDAVQQRSKRLKGRNNRGLNKETPLQIAVNNDNYWASLWLLFAEEYIGAFIKSTLVELT